jgi:hypothetical protein
MSFGGAGFADFRKIFSHSRFLAIRLTFAATLDQGARRADYRSAGFTDSFTQGFTRAFMRLVMPRHD